MEKMFRETIEIEAVKHMAEALLASENKKLKTIEKFSVPTSEQSLPDGVYLYRPGRYCLRTPDGVAEIKEGDYVMQTLDSEFYYLRMEPVE